MPGIYTSHHNVVGYDLVSSGARLPAGSVPELDPVNLVRRIREDLAVVVWDDEAERDEQYGLLEAAEARLGVTPADAEERGPSLGELARGFIAARRAPAPVEYPSLLDAAREADRFYAAASCVKAVILAGGLGTRLAEETGVRPEADGRDRRPADPLAHHEDLRRARDRRLRRLPRLQGLRHQGVLRQLLPARRPT